ncbi:hydrolase [Marinibactrum halimedae]|uniref:Peptidase M20 dimerisation domain-containing protein n=1 Tax=Marinibactrum halimedae TaxID=1444977 RepID=A0AA37WMK5_9GAMM|nr:hydrolase [Marinibactrum halimedae]MCD9460184.1 hydrolase [Marinibactrum halimedae]GLS26345.1 hypothetical protein GCM10007877_20600 [Marinibactrum halimedae]
MNLISNVSPSVLEGLEYLQGQQDTMLENTLALANINSGTRHLAGLAQVHDRLYDLFSPIADISESIALAPTQALGDDGVLHDIHYGNALRFVKYPEAPIRVFLCGHMDTVFPVDHPFQTCQFLDDNRVNGPGTADMKGGLMVMLHALKAWEQHPLSHQLGWEIIINSDEETGSLGSSDLLVKHASNAHMGMVFEPALADGTLAGSRKGSGNFSLLVSGLSAHAGREFSLGRNAIAGLSHAMSQLHQWNEREGITVNLGRISGGGPLNVVTDTAVCHFNIRTQTTDDQHWAEERLRELVSRINDSKPPFEDQLKATLHGAFYRPPKPLSEPNLQLFQWLAQCGEQLDIAIHHKPTGGCCDGNNLVAAGLPNIDTLGVRGANIHTADEFMCVDSLSERARLSFLLLDAFARNGDAYLESLSRWRASVKK